MCSHFFELHFASFLFALALLPLLDHHMHVECELGPSCVTVLYLLPWVIHKDEVISCFLKNGNGFILNFTNVNNFENLFCLNSMSLFVCKVVIRKHHYHLKKFCVAALYQVRCFVNYITVTSVLYIDMYLYLMN